MIIDLVKMGQDTFSYIYIYINRERERERERVGVPGNGVTEFGGEQFR